MPKQSFVLNPLQRRWDHLLRSNDPPLDAEIPKRLDALDLEINKLRSERDEISDCIQRHSAILAPIRRVPADLLSEIFSLVSFTRLVNGVEEQCAPWSLGLICRSWRYLAIHSPLLWRHIVIPPAGYLSDFSPSMLQEAHFLSQAPALREAAFLSDHIFRHTFHIPWAQITHFRGSFDTEIHLGILTSVQNLVECSVVFGGDPLPPSDNTIALPHLRRLCIADDASVSDRITAPLLEELKMEWDNTLLIPKVLSFVDRSSCHLTRVIVDNFPLDHIHRILHNLKYLILTSSELPHGFWDAMTLSDTQDNHFPHLEFLACHWQETHCINSIHAMMQSRNLQKPGRKALSSRCFNDDDMEYTFEEHPLLKVAHENPQFDVAFLSDSETPDAMGLSWNPYWGAQTLLNICYLKLSFRIR
ncbi:hypothetical protein FB45DRAFT_1119126 [Roridomyces roridus]|uniref:F-box domain-containing protein n=1 Tax=Roridomyces roridus TaxID=1738132 RepID=A0AAD7B618_9AGAR|nr:hypothetical protein FB45DRAFT_1119126 [Roridomyces roridus]